MSSSRLLKAVTLGFALTLSSNVFAASAQQLLTEDLQLAIKTLPRETRLYHYFGINLNGNQLKNTILKNSKARYDMVNDRVKQIAASFWDLKNNSTYLANAGLGVYLAVDPYASSPAAAPDTGANFGSTMIEMTFNAGTRYLDLIDSVPLRPETLQAIISETGMQQADVAKLFQAKKKGFWRDTLQYMAEAKNTAFRKIVHNIFNQEGIVMTEYGWQAGTSMFCNTANNSGKVHHSALVYVGGALTQNAIKSVTMVYWNDSTGVEFDVQETEAMARNQKLVSVLQPLRPLEKQYQTAYNSKDKAAMKSTYSEIKNIINNTYLDQNELLDLRSKTFDCIK